MVNGYSIPKPCREESPGLDYTKFYTFVSRKKPVSGLIDCMRMCTWAVYEQDTSTALHSCRSPLEVYIHTSFTFYILLP